MDEARGPRAALAALDRSPLALPALLAATAAATAAGMALRVPYLLPFLQAAAGFPFFVAACVAGSPLRAALRTLLFVAVSCAVVTAFVAGGAVDAWSASVPNGIAYRDEMVAFLRSGGTEGKEATPSLFLPEHATHLGLFSILCVATAGFGALVLGSGLADYMSYYVGSIVAMAADGGDPLRTLLLSWAPYAIVRVIAFASLGSGLTTLVVGPRATRVHAVRAIALGFLLAVVDVLAKAVLAGWYGATLWNAIQPAPR